MRLESLKRGQSHTGDKPLEFILVVLYSETPLYFTCKFLWKMVVLCPNTSMTTRGTKLAIVTTMTFKCGARAPKVFPSGKKSSSGLILFLVYGIEYLLVQGVHFIDFRIKLLTVWKWYQITHSMEVVPRSWGDKKYF